MKKATKSVLAVFMIVIVSLMCFASCTNHIDMGAQDSTTKEHSARDDSAVDSSAVDSSSLYTPDSLPPVTDPTTISYTYNAATAEPCNKANGNYVIVIDDNAYYLDLNDNGFLCRSNLTDMSEKVRIGSISSDSIFAKFRILGTKLYYLVGKGWEEISDDEAEYNYRKQIMICYDIETGYESVILDERYGIIEYDIIDDSIYFSSIDGFLYKYLPDSTVVQSLCELGFPVSVRALKKKLYLGFDEMLAVYNTESGKTDVYNLPHYNYAITDEGVYYISTNDCCLYYIDWDFDSHSAEFDPFEDEFSVYSSPIEEFNISGDYIFVVNLSSDVTMALKRDDNTIAAVVDGNFPILTENGIFTVIDSAINFINLQ